MLLQRAAHLAAFFVCVVTAPLIGAGRDVDVARRLGRGEWHSFGF